MEGRELVRTFPVTNGRQTRGRYKKEPENAQEGRRQEQGMLGLNFLHL